MIIPKGSEVRMSQELYQTLKDEGFTVLVSGSVEVVEKDGL